jgi:hypothetical protein
MSEPDRSAREPLLVWGVKQSFRNYVEATGGTIGVAGEAERLDDGAFAFVPAPGATSALDAEGRPAGSVAFLGEVRFQAHGGMLSVFLADPSIEPDAEGAVLMVADAPSRKYRIPIARLDLSAAEPLAEGGLSIPAAVTIEGMQLLGDHYPPRTPLDPVRIRLS